MRNTYALSLLALSLAFLYGVAYIGSSLTHTPPPQLPQPRGDGPGAPRYIKQWRKMKLNPEQPDYRQLVRRLRQESVVPYAKTTASNLLNIVELGPDNIGGRTRAIVFDHADTDHIVTGGVSGGIWHSYDRGDSWMPVSDQLPTLSVTDICQDPNDANVWYFATGEVTGNSADIDGDGIYKSTDGGLTWSQLAATDNNDFLKNWCIQHSPTEANTIYVGTGGNGLFKSTDGGDSFEQVLPNNKSNSHVTDLILFNDGRVMASLRNDGVYVSPDGSANSFTEIGGGLPTTDFRRIQLAVCDNQPNNVFAAYEDRRESTYDSGLKGIWKSTDGGLTWAELPTNPEDFNIFMRFNWYAFAFEVKPDDPDYIVVGSVELGYTNNGGQSWTETSYGHADQHTCVFDPDNSNRFLIGNDGGIYRYATLTAGFFREDLNDGYNVTQYYAGSYGPLGDQAWGGTQDNGTLAFFLNGSNFDRIYGADGAFNGISQQNASLGYLSWQNGMILRTFNAQSQNPNFTFILNELDGDNDFEIDDAVWFINPFYLNPADGNQVYFVTQERVWRTANSGTNWTPITNKLPTDLYACGISNDADPTIYYGGETGRFFRIDNALSATAGSEINLSNTVPDDVDNSFIGEITVDPDDPGTIMVAFHDYLNAPRLYRVFFANTSSPLWLPLDGLPQGMPVNSIAIHPNATSTHWVAGTDFGVYSTQDAGGTWTKETSIPNVPVAQVKIRNDGQLYVWTHGRGLWGADFLTDDEPVSRSELPQMAQLKLYPNPAREQITVDWPGQRDASFIITDAKGRNVAGGSLAASQRVGLKGLAPGVYFLRARAGQQTAVKRFVVVE